MGGSWQAKIEQIGTLVKQDLLRIGTINDLPACIIEQLQYRLEKGNSVECAGRLENTARKHRCHSRGIPQASTKARSVLRVASQ